MDLIIKLFTLLRVPENYILPASGIFTLILFLLLSYFIFLSFNTISKKYLKSKYFKLNNLKWHKGIRRTNFLSILGYLGVGLIAYFMVPFFFPETYQKYNAFASRIVSIYFQVCILIIINKTLSLIMHIYNRPNMPIKGIIQFIKIFVNFFGALIILAFLIGKEPTYFISALGIFASVLMIVFKDTIVGLTAGWQLSMNKMVKIGDWIEMPSNGADGDVIDISLTTVSVQNWDKTIVTIPAYDLISKSFINWRGMRESGGRRIKRSIIIDMQSIRFVDKEMFDKLSKLELLKDYLENKKKEIIEYNKNMNTQESLYNGRYLTNLGTFRAYCDAYIKSRPYINENMTRMVRQRQPTAEGLPLEIYCFTATVVWVEYENYQSDLFDHLLSIMKEFDLYVFQNPSSRNFSSLIHKI